MKQKLNRRNLVLVGVTLFSMFFGAGNLIFPPYVGYAAGTRALWAFAGLILTAVCAPVLGVAAVAKTGGADRLFWKVHPKFGEIFTIAVFLCIGPLLAIPRTAGTSFSMFSFALAPLARTGAGMLALRAVFSAAFFFGAYLLARRPERFKDILGKLTTPALLVLIALIFVCGTVKLTGAPAAPQGAYADNAFFAGFSEGYQTMDALAAIVFGYVVAANIRACGVTDERAAARESVRAGVIAGVLLAVVYGVLAFLGARAGAAVPQAADGTAILSGLCMRLFGPWGAWLLALVFFVACFNVCTGLLSSCAAFFSREFPKRSFLWWLRLFAAASFCISILGLERILKLSVPVLTLLYPVALVGIVLNLLPFSWAQRPAVHRAAAVLAFAAGIWSLAM